MLSMIGDRWPGFITASGPCRSRCWWRSALRIFRHAAAFPFGPGFRCSYPDRPGLAAVFIGGISTVGGKIAIPLIFASVNAHVG